jgi:two-component system osmolarity sensor histidine kinase EnvZ
MPSSPIDGLAAAVIDAGDISQPAAPPEIRRGSVVKRMLPQTMFGRSLLLIVMPLVLVQIIATWVFYARHWESVSYRFSSDVAGDIAMVIERMQKEALDPTELRRLFNRIEGVSEIAFEFRADAGLPASAPVGASILETQLRRAIVKRVDRPFSLDTESSPNRVLISVQLDDGVLLANVPLSRLYTPTTYIFILWMVGSSLVLLAIATIFLRNQVRSLRRLAVAAEAFGKGRNVAFSKVEGALEVRQAATAFIQMRDRIQRQIRQRTEMLAGVSHDLRTPLTRMKLALALAGSDPVVDELKSDVSDMERLVNLYLDFARGEGTESPVATDIALLLEDVAASARREGMPLSLEPPAELIVPVRPNALRRCIDNLITNAKLYGGNVWLASRSAADGIDILVDDDGPGIPAAERERVFRPFVRLDASRNPSTGGVGLGLAIARDVARSHGGDVRLETSPRGGLRARIHLPR